MKLLKYITYNPKDIVFVDYHRDMFLGYSLSGWLKLYYINSGGVGFISGKYNKRFKI